MASAADAVPAPAGVTLESEARCHGGRQLTFTHESKACKCVMRFAVFVPSAGEVKVPVLYFLSGLTCTEKNFSEKAGAQRAAAELGVALVMPDTSPRGDDVPDDKEGAYDFGKGAGFYLDAVEEPFSTHFRMETYIMEELPQAVAAAVGSFVDVTRASVFGHSMGGHGAITLALRHPGRFASVSAFAPICNPSSCPWGKKALGGYLGAAAADLPVTDRKSWASHDASMLAAGYDGPPLTLLVYQGMADNFLSAGQLLPDALQAAAATNDKITVDYFACEGYDHSYWFIQTFVSEHIAFHAAALAVRT